MHLNHHVTLHHEDTGNCSPNQSIKLHQTLRAHEQEAGTKYPQAANLKTNINTPHDCSYEHAIKLLYAVRFGMSSLGRSAWALKTVQSFNTYLDERSLGHDHVSQMDW